MASGQVTCSLLFLLYLDFAAQPWLNHMQIGSYLCSLSPSVAASTDGWSLQPIFNLRNFSHCWVPMLSCLHLPTPPPIFLNIHWQLSLGSDVLKVSLRFFYSARISEFPAFAVISWWDLTFAWIFDFSFLCQITWFSIPLPFRLPL